MKANGAPAPIGSIPPETRKASAIALALCGEMGVATYRCNPFFIK